MEIIDKHQQGLTRGIGFLYQLVIPLGLSKGSTNAKVARFTLLYRQIFMRVLCYTSKTQILGHLSLIMSAHYPNFKVL